VLEPRLEAVLQEIAAGNPVLVLQNLALDWAPQMSGTWTPACLVNAVPVTALRPSDGWSIGRGKLGEKPEARKTA
jgi:hypothetical protein